VSIAEPARRAAGCLDFTISADLLDPGPHQHLRALGVASGPRDFRSSGPDKEQRAAMLTVAVQEYIADVRPVFGERTA
jgi:hypothetical protein